MELFIAALIAVVYGIVEGITEWLPISSTGHMIILEAIPGFGIRADTGEDFFEFFLVVIQLGAILAVIVSFFSRLNPFGKRKTEDEKKIIWHKWLNIVIGCIPAGVVGVLMKLLMNSEQEAALNSVYVVSCALIIYGAVFIVLERWLKHKTKVWKATLKAGEEASYPYKYPTVEAFDWKIALYIGLFQILSLIPGTSRSGVTISGALLLSCSRSAAAEYSFYLSIPVMLGASIVEGIGFLTSGTAFTATMGVYTGVGVVVAFLVSLVTIKALMKWVKNHTFEGFGYYRIAIGALILGLSLGGII